MFRKYGLIGILLILLTELNFFFKVEPFASKYFIIVWLGYILAIDALVYKLNKKSLIMNDKTIFVTLFVLSAVFWWIFELMNLKVGNWAYNGISGVQALGNVAWKTVYFSTVLPAFFETYDLIKSAHIFSKTKLHVKYKISKYFLHSMFIIGIIMFLLPLFFPTYFYPLIWMTFFFILDPINYIHKQPSIIQHIKDRKIEVILGILLSGIIMGFFWEFWNYWAVNKWTYNIPFVGFFKIFEMPLLGYLGYFPFALSLYSMYWFTRSLFVHKEHLLE